MVLKRVPKREYYMDSLPPLPQHSTDLDINSVGWDVNGHVGTLCGPPDFEIESIVAF